MLIARLQTAKPLANHEFALLESYLARIKSLLLALKSYEHIKSSRDVRDRSRNDE